MLSLEMNEHIQVTCYRGWRWIWKSH